MQSSEGHVDNGNEAGTPKRTDELRQNVVKIVSEYETKMDESKAEGTKRVGKGHSFLPNTKEPEPTLDKFLRDQRNAFRNELHVPLIDDGSYHRNMEYNIAAMDLTLTILKLRKSFENKFGQNDTVTGEHLVWVRSEYGYEATSRTSINEALKLTGHVMDGHISLTKLQSIKNECTEKQRELKGLQIDEPDDVPEPDTDEYKDWKDAETKADDGQTALDAAFRDTYKTILSFREDKGNRRYKVFAEACDKMHYDIEACGLSSSDVLNVAEFTKAIHEKYNKAHTTLLYRTFDSVKRKNPAGEERSLASTFAKMQRIAKKSDEWDEIDSDLVENCSFMKMALEQYSN